MTINKKESLFLKISFIISFLLLIAGLFVLNRFLSTIHPEVKTTPKPQLTKIVRVIDGDTVVTENNQKIRLIGIDTPEINTNNSKKCSGQIATTKMKELVEGKYVTLEKDVSETDKYNRLLRYIWINDTMVNTTLIQQGYAEIDTINPDTKYEQIFYDAQTQAKNQKLGLWNEFNCSVVNQN